MIIICIYFSIFVIMQGSGIRTKRQQFRVSIRKNHIHGIFSNGRRDLMRFLINQKEEEIMNDQMDPERISNDIRNIQTRIKQSFQYYDFQLCFKALQEAADYLSKHRNHHEKIISNKMIESEVITIGLKMYMTAIDLRKEQMVVHALGLQIINILEYLISSAKYTMDRIHQEALVEILIGMMKQGSSNNVRMSKIAFILANIMIDCEHCAKNILNSQVLQIFITNIQKFRIEIDSLQNLRLLFFIRILLEQNQERTDPPAHPDSMKTIVDIVSLTIRKFSVRSTKKEIQKEKGDEQRSLADAIFILRKIVCGDKWVRYDFILSRTSLTELAEILQYSGNEYEVEQQILKIFDHFAFRDTNGRYLYDLVQQNRLIQTIWEKRKNHLLIVLNTMISLAHMDKVKDQFEPVLDTILVYLFQNRLTIDYLKIIYNWFDSQKFVAEKEIDHRLIAKLTDAFMNQEDDDLVELLGEFFYRLTENGYTGPLPVCFERHTDIEIIEETLDYMQMKFEEMNREDSTMNQQESISFQKLRQYQ